MLINGAESAQLDLRDRGLQYGDGLFETLAVVDAQPMLTEPHLSRLFRGCDRLGIPRPDRQQLIDEMQQVTTGCAKGVLKLMITRGTGSRGYNPAGADNPTRIVYTTPWPEYPRSYQQSGIQARLCDTRLGINPALAGIKHNNRLEQVLARAEWQDPQIAEGVMLDTEGWVIEGTMSNLFLVIEDRLCTPSLERCGIAGVMRERVLEVAGGLGLDPVERRISRQELESAEALFFTNSLIGVWPVRRLDGIEYATDRINHSLVREVMAQGFTPGERDCSDHD